MPQDRISPRRLLLTEFGTLAAMAASGREVSARPRSDRDRLGNDLVADQTVPGPAAPNFRSSVSAADFAAKLDVQTDDGPALNAALGTGKSVIVPFTKPGIFLGSQVNVGPGQFLSGENRAVRLRSTAASPIRITGTGPSGIANFRIDMRNSPPRSAAITLATSGGIVYDVRIAHLQFTNCVTAITDEPSESHYTANVYIEDVRCSFTRGVQIKSNRSRGSMLLRGVAVHHTHNTKPVSWHGLWFRDFVGLELQRIEINGPTAVVQRPLRNRAIGVNIEGGRPGGLQSPSVWMKRVLVDNTMGSGIHVENVLNLLMQEVEVYQNLGWGMRFLNCTEVLADRVYAMGGSGMPGASAAGHGIHFKGCSDVLASNLLSRHSTGDGVLLDGCTDCTFNNINCNHNAGWGWAEINRCDRNIKQGGRFYDNGVGSIAQVGNGSATVNYVPSSGVFTASTAGPARIL